MASEQLDELFLVTQDIVKLGRFKNIDSLSRGEAGKQHPDIHNGLENLEENFCDYVETTRFAKIRQYDTDAPVRSYGDLETVPTYRSTVPDVDFYATRGRIGHNIISYLRYQGLDGSRRSLVAEQITINPRYEWDAADRIVQLNRVNTANYGINSHVWDYSLEGTDAASLEQTHHILHDKLLQLICCVLPVTITPTRPQLVYSDTTPATALSLAPEPANADQYPRLQVVR